MFEYYIWVLAFVFLYISVFWIIIFSLKERKYLDSSVFPEVSIIVPAYNEEKNIEKTLNSLKNLDYPKDKLKIIVVDDCSTDNTPDIVKKFKDIELISREKRGGNAAISLNTGLKHVNTELFSRVDSDSYVERDSLKKLTKYFSDKKVGIVISSVLVSEPKNNLEKMQKFEYIITSFTRKLMSKIGTLHISPGVLSVYRTDLLKESGCFDEKNLTEDYEIALRLRKHNYQVIMEPESVTHTHVPNTILSFWKQRIRWYRGFIVNNLKYKDMFFSRKHGILGVFQMPIALFSMFLVLISFVLFSYNFLNIAYKFIYKIITLKLEILGIPKLPSLVDIILSIDVRVYVPVLLSLVFAVYIYIKAHKNYNERRVYPLVTIIYLFFYPIITSIQWFHAFVLEALGVKRTW